MWSPFSAARAEVMERRLTIQILKMFTMNPSKDKYSSIIVNRNRQRLFAKIFLIWCVKTLLQPANCGLFFGSKKPLLDAQMATPCGHTFCGKCVHQLKGTSRPVPCPLCCQIVQEFCRNIFVTQLLTRVQKDCLACKDKVQLDTAQQHIVKCQEIDVVCLQCNKQ